MWFQFAFQDLQRLKLKSNLNSYTFQRACPDSECLKQNIFPAQVLGGQRENNLLLWVGLVDKSTKHRRKATQSPSLCDQGWSLRLRSCNSQLGGGRKGRWQESIPGIKSVLTNIPLSLQYPSKAHPRGVNTNEQKMVVDESHNVKYEKAEESHRTEMGFH